MDIQEHSGHTIRIRMQTTTNLKRRLTECPNEVATLKARKGAFEALNHESGALGKVK